MQRKWWPSWKVPEIWSKVSGWIVKQALSRQSAYFGVRILAIALVFGVISQVSAQDTEEPWTEPVNLSLSGTAAGPRLVVEANDSVFVIWKDIAANTFVHSREEGNGWSQPVVTEQIGRAHV